MTLSNRSNIPMIRSAALALVLAVAVQFSPDARAQSGGMGAPTERMCILLGMLGVQPPACRDEAEPGLPQDVLDQLDALALSIMPFFNYDVAVSAGWDTILGECVESPMGGMGYHVHNMDQLMNGHLNLLRPEVLLYAPTEDGSMQFHGVEYIIPADLWTEPFPPEFLGQELEFNPNVPPNGIWALHVWAATPNPDGLFAPFNPEVSCQYAVGED
ncbi:hypothetical protein HFP89_13265 [Wenzhouxiangella sp. XN79A]|uniref:hypothetical protein n=1 Tax=Wenzhouxiangella sp. XN79A TaxID=2724193 RepID=UPI00144AC750|nr:hypothetical protein [Wenzhouxiangella sp. XN79A]NKI36134.1 hypothetical protein [Wenzhouxiangella sp. XN79A]